MSDIAIVVDRVTTERGELALRRDGEHFEIISNGVFLMDTRNGASERVLVREALALAEPGSRLLIGGLGVGFSLAEAVASDLPAEIVVLEIEKHLIEWHRGPLAAVSGRALADPRVRLVNDDLVGWLHGADETFDAICLDIDNGPDWTVFDGNAALYDDTGLRLLRDRLTAGGVLAIWSARGLAGVRGPPRGGHRTGHHAPDRGAARRTRRRIPVPPHLSRAQQRTRPPRMTRAQPGDPPG